MKLAPFQYIHVLDKNKNIIRIETGPQNFVKLDHEEIVTGESPVDFIVLKPYTFALINDPVIRSSTGELQIDAHGQIKVRFGDQEIRTDRQYPEAFPLYPGESLRKIDRLTVIPRDCALKVRANRDFEQGSIKRLAGDEWQIKGPEIYVPRIEEDKIIIIRAKYQCVDADGNQRKPGEEWLIRHQGQYLLGVNEVLVEIVNGMTLTDKKAICLTAIKSFQDVYGNHRKAGEEWLVTNQIASVHILDVYEKVVCEVPITVLTSDDYCYLLNPIKDGINQMGKKELIVGPTSFFLNPGEVLEDGIKKSYILSDDEALLLTALEDFHVKVGDKKEVHKPGEKWMIYGPCRFVPPVEVKVLETRKALPMDYVEVYIRNTNSGNIRAEVGHTYMLKEDEELVAKPCSDVVNELMLKQGNIQRREPYSLISFKCPFNAVVQVYDYRSKKNRCVFGPDLVSLKPDEQFTVTYLSGSTPKVPGRVKTLYLLLGPTFSTDVCEVETSDHARLEIKLSYNWRFLPKSDDPGIIFHVRDFIGDMCKTMSSKVRATVASVPFDLFHKASVRTIRKAIFGYDPETDKVKDSIFFPENGLEIFNVDIQSIEPKDKNTKESLNKTVTQAIQITTKIQEQEARRIADKMEQEEKGKLERLVLDNNSVVEQTKENYLKLKAESDAIKSKGQAIAEAKAKAEAAEISAKAEVLYAQLKAEAKKIKEGSKINYQKEKQEIEYMHEKAKSELAILQAKELADIESKKFSTIMESIGQDTLVDIAMAGPEMQAQMLSSLGLSGYMLMGSDNPVNLFSAAAGMIGDKKTQQSLRSQSI